MPGQTRTGAKNLVLPFQWCKNLIKRNGACMGIMGKNGQESSIPFDIDSWLASIYQPTLPFYQLMQNWEEVSGRYAYITLAIILQLLSPTGDQHALRSAVCARRPRHLRLRPEWIRLRDQRAT